MPIGFFKLYQIKTEAPPSATAAALIPKFESTWHQPWSEPVRFRRLATAHQQVLAVPVRYLPKPDVTATMAAISDPGISTALITVLILNEPPSVLPDLTSVNVAVTEAEDGGASASVRGDE